jgi:CheY-specific phosphatase CheX
MVLESNLAELQEIVADEWRRTLEEEGFLFDLTDDDEEVEDAHDSGAE